MRFKAVQSLVVILFVLATTAFAGDSLDGAYKFVSVKFPGGSQNDSQMRGLIVVHGKHLAFVRAGVGRESWDQDEPEEQRTKKIVSAFQGLGATAGTFEVEGDTLTLTQLAQANPSSMGAKSKWKFKLEGKTLTLKPEGNQDVEFTFERLP